MADAASLAWLASLAPIALGSYVFVSSLFYYYPHLLHGRKTQTRAHNFVVVSHRGGAGENLENTMTAFSYSDHIGVDVVELDVHLTKDGQVVVSHDNYLGRTAKLDKHINELMYSELPRLLPHTTEDINAPRLSRVVSSSLITNPIHTLNVDMEHLSLKIPLLEEVFHHFPDLPINLDIKFHCEELIEKVHALIVKYKREHLTVWGSFDEGVARKCYRRNPGIELYFSRSGVTRLFMLLATGLLPFVPLKQETYYEVVMPDYILTQTNLLPRSMMIALRIFKFLCVRKSFVKHLQNRGIQVFFWVLNTDEEFRRALELGVDGIITDYPSRLIRFIEEEEPYCRTLVRPAPRRQQKQ